MPDNKTGEPWEFIQWMVRQNQKYITALICINGQHQLVGWWDGDCSEEEKILFNGTYFQCKERQQQIDCEQREAELF